MLVVNSKGLFCSKKFVSNVSVKAFWYTKVILFIFKLFYKINTYFNDIYICILGLSSKLEAKFSSKSSLQLTNLNKVIM